MEQLHTSTPALPTPEQGASARPHASLTLDQFDRITLHLAHIKSLAYVMAKFGDDNLGAGGDDLLSCSQIIDGIVDGIKAELQAGTEVRHG